MVRRSGILFRGEVSVIRPLGGSMRFFYVMFCDVFLSSWFENTEKNQRDSWIFYRRSYDSKYRQKQSVVKNFWIVACILVLIQPALHVMLVVGMFTTFLSFMYLDES